MLKFFVSVAMPLLSHESRRRLPRRPIATGVLALALLCACRGAAAVLAPGTPIVTDEGSYTAASDQLTANWFTIDIGGQILEYQYQVTRQSATGPAVRTWTSVGLATAVTATGLPLQNGEIYYVGVRARYGTNNYTSTGSTNGIIVDNTAPNVTNVNDGGAYTKAASSLSLSWSGADSGSGVRSYRYSVGTTAGATNVRAWTNVGTNTALTINGLSLTSGTTYYCNIEATDVAGNVRIVSSDGITSDRVPPTVTVQDDGEVTTNGTSLHATWSGSDALSGIKEYQYSIGTLGAPESLVPWTSRGTQTSVTVNGLSLVDGILYIFRVKAIDRADNTFTKGSDGILAQLSGPEVHAVIDNGSYTPDEGSLSASWIVSGGNITEYRYAIGTSAGATNVVPWTSVGLNTSVTRTGLALVNGHSYYFSVRAYDNSGHYGTGSSDGIMVDLGNPTLGVIVDAGEYTADANSLTFSFSGSDAESGVREYQYAIGTAVNYQSLVPWTSSGLATSRTVSGLSLVQGETYYISVYAVDNAGHVAMGTSDGIGLDVSPPVIDAVVDSGAITTLHNELSASWHASDPMGVAGYRFAIGTAPGASNVAGWTDVGLNTSATVTNLTLQSNQTYYFTLTALDVTGRSATKSSDGIGIDNGAPFGIDDVPMGDANLCYMNPEFSDDGQYVVWGERVPLLNEAGEGILRMWHCGVDQKTGAFVPWDCKGHSGFDSTTLGRAYVGRDSQGVFYLGANEDYQLTMTRITGPDSGVTTTLASLADPERRAIYPSVLPGSNKIYAYWLKSHGTSVAPADADWVELRYVDIADPANEMVVVHQDNMNGLVPLDVTFPRWAFRKPLLIYGHPNEQGMVNIYQVDVSQPQLLPPVQLTNDWHRKTGPYPIEFEGKRYIITGVDGTAESYIYGESPGGGSYEIVDSFAPLADQTFSDACLANSHEPFIMNNKLFTSYQITDCQGQPPNTFAFLSQPGEIWFKELLNGSDGLWRISESNTNVRNEPEPIVGNDEAWVYYSTYPPGFDETNACPEIHRAATPAALSAP